MCGVLGVIGSGPVIGDIVDGLLFLQHRGQDAAGAATYDGSKFRTFKQMGLVREVFAQEDLSRHRGNMGIGHVRYPTIGGGDVDDAQPFVVNSPFGIAMAHNGNLTNFKALRDELQDRARRHVGSNCDVEVILNVFADELSRRTSGNGADPAAPETTEACFESVGGTFRRCRGSYSVCAVVAGVGLLAFRDPFGIKPLVFGKKRDGDGFRWMVASETCALESLGYTVERDVRPGEAILFRPGAAPIARQVGESRSRLCVFEFIYFANPSSVIDGVSVYHARLNLGKSLARRWGERNATPGVKPIDADRVIPVPDSSRPAAQEMAFQMRKPFREGLLKNRYIGRTFIMAGNEKRKQGIRFKLSPVRLEIQGNRVLLVDDSIVRGNTANEIIRMVRETGATEVHVASSCPPLRFPCVYGVDMSTRDEFIARDRTEDQIRGRIGADSLLYQSIPDMVEAVRAAALPAGSAQGREYCMACMDGRYPTGDVTSAVLDEIENERLKNGES
jgi:amidophosphoribosyltransferase